METTNAFLPNIGQMCVSHLIGLCGRHFEWRDGRGIVLSFNRSHNLYPDVDSHDENLDIEEDDTAWYTSQDVAIEYSLYDFVDFLKAAVTMKGISPAHETNGLDSLGSPASTLGKRHAIYLFDRLKSLAKRTARPIDANTNGPQRYPVSTWRAIGLSDKAIEIFGQVNSICSKVCCPGTVSTVQFLEDIAWSYYNAGRNREALGVYQGLIDSGLRTGNPITENLYRMSKTLEALGHFDRALSAHQQTWIRFKAERCKDTTLGSHALKSMGIILCKSHQYSQAVSLYKQALLLEVHELGPGHPEIVSTLVNLAGAYGCLRRYTTCVRLNQLALALIRRTGRAKDEELANIHHNIALALAGRGKECFADARRHFARSHHLYLRIFGPEHQRTKGAASLFYSARRQAALQRSPRKTVVTRFRSQRYRTRRGRKH